MSGGGQRVTTVGLLVVTAATCAVGFGGSSSVDTTLTFEEYAPGTVLTNQYADFGGPGQGVAFGPLPGGAGDGLRPVIRTPPAGQAQSGSNVADIATCPGCEFFTPRTTGTLATPRSRLSVYVGYLGTFAICQPLQPDSPACAFVTLRAFDSSGKAVAESAVRVSRGAGVHTEVSVSTASATIVGFEITARPTIDASKQIAIDDLSLSASPSRVPPDFTLNPSATSLSVTEGESATTQIAIGRLNGSSGDVSMRADGLPAGVHAAFAPNPASGTRTVLTVTADPGSAAATTAVTIVGTPQSPSVGPATRTFTLGITVKTACPRIGTVAQLIDRVARGYKCIFVVNSARIDLADLDDARVSTPDAAIVIPDGVTLMGGRSPTEPGGLLEMSKRGSKQFMLQLGENARVTGLRLRGYNQHDTKDRGDRTRAIFVSGRAGVLVDNNEIFGWPLAAVYIQHTPTDGRAVPRITRNFIHHNVQCGKGYGVDLGGGGFALVDRNLFDYNRHDVAGPGGKGPGFIAELNFSLTSGPKCGGVFKYYNQHYDMHGDGKDGYGGVAGTYMEIRRNTIRGAQQYFQTQRRPAFWLRGTPEDRAIFEENAVHNKNVLGRAGAVRVTGDSDAMKKAGKLVIRRNRLCVDTASELAVGDSNGDGRADVFQATGTLWAYSPSGSREWHFLNDSPLRLARLRLGDFDGDGKTDVFFQEGGRWLVSYGGTGPPTALPFGSSIPFGRYRFGDFDGDGRTDVFRTNGKRFYFSSSGATGWQPLVASRLSIDELRFGDSDGDGTTDVFSLANNAWSVSYGGKTPWRRLNRRLSSNLDELVFADFDGDGRTDNARSHKGRWQVSYGGTTGWRTLQSRRRESLTVGVLVADFTGDGKADVLQHGEVQMGLDTSCWAVRNRNSAFRSFTHYRLSDGGTRPFTRWSSAAMR